MNAEANRVKLSPGAVRSLIDAARLEPTAASPIAVLLRGVSPASAQDVLRQVDRVRGKAALREAVDVLGRPEALVRLTAVAPGEENRTLNFAIRDGLGAAFSLEDDALEIAPAQALEALVGSLAAGLACAGPLAGKEASLWPSALQVLTALWQDDLDPERLLSRAETRTRLAGAQGDLAGADSLLAQVAAAGAVRVDRETIAIDERLRPWLGRLWSGHVAQVAHQPLDPDVPLDQAVQQSGERLLFVGPPGQRVLNETVTGEALARLYPGEKPPEPKLLHLSGLDETAVVGRLRGFLHAATRSSA